MSKPPSEVVGDISKYNHSLEDFLSERISSARFRGVRVPWGVYSQRKGIDLNIYMARIRLPGGVANGKQLKALAEASRKFANGVLHVTDRQDIQIHNVPIEKTGGLMEYLKEYGLSPRGGGGNTVRNITSCPLSGICDKELFDVGEYVIGLTEYMLKDEASYNLPRKYKIAFSGCSLDCAHATVNDLGFISKTKTVDGKEVQGFSVYVGGGLGASSRVGQLLEEFIQLEDVGYIAEAVKRTFNTHGNRRDKHHARLRFLIEKVGLEEFRKLYEEELKKLKGTEKIDLRRVEVTYPNSGGDEITGGEDDEEFTVFRKHNVGGQKQEGFYTVEVGIRLGDIKADDLEKLGSLEDEFPGIGYRTTQRQNIIICNVCGSEVYPLFKRLEEFDLALPYSSTAIDVVCCAGASTCNLGVCDSKAMGFELIKTLEDSLDLNELDKLKDVSININGCPNACGHAPIGFIGLTGMTRRVDNRMVPFYKVSLGGRVEEGKTRLNEETGLVPARNTPKVLKDFLVETQSRINSYGDRYEYLNKEGIELMKNIIEKYSQVPSYSEDSSFYRDWGKTEDFTLAGIGSSECGAGVMEIIESDISDAEKSILEAGKSFNVEPIKDALHYGARALLVVKGIDSRTPEETFEGFLKEIISQGVCLPKFKDIKKVYDSLNTESSTTERKENLALAKDLLEDVKEAFKLMDNSFNFRERYSSESSE